MIDKETAQKILDKYNRDYATFSEKATRKEFHTVLKYVADESNRRQRRQVGLDKHHFTTFHAPKGIKIQTTPNFLYD